MRPHRVNRQKLTTDGALYLATDAELFVPIGEDVTGGPIDHLRVRSGFGYRASFAWRLETLYIWAGVWRDGAGQPCDRHPREAGVLKERTIMKFRIFSVLAVALLGATPAFAQLNGANILGDTGVDTATQPPPGFYVGGLYYHYRTDTVRKADGSKLTLDPSQPSSLSIPAFAPTFVYVAKGTIFGEGHYGVMVAPSVTNSSLEAPGFGFSSTSSTTVGDTYIVPVQIGWHLAQADITTAFGIWAPTGRYNAGATINNTGRGMWTYEASAGTTVFIDNQKTWSAATTAYFETHGKKEGTAVNVGRADQIALGGVRVGDILSLEGGFAREFAHGAAHAGLAYYAQWKVTDDDFGIPVTAPGGTVLSKHRVYGFGPDVTIPIATKSALIAFVNVRYFWETGAEVKTEGQALVLTMTFPVPSVNISKTK